MSVKIGDFGAWSKEDLEKSARENLNEDPRRSANDVKAIQDWIKRQPHLNKNVRTGTCGEPTSELSRLISCKSRFSSSKIQNGCSSFFEKRKNGFRDFL